MDKVLKQRLIGASILIALAVIFVPMLFDGPADSPESREMSIELPSAPGDRAPVRRLQLNPDQARATPREEEDDTTSRIEPTRMASENAVNAPSRDELMAEIQAEADEVVAAIDPPAQPPDQSSSEDGETTSSNPLLTMEPLPSEPESAPVEPEPEPEPVVTAPVTSTAASAGDTANRGFVVLVACFGSI
ncbi:MAG: hypothetical protein AAGJ52_04075 [Pseudomonadota bacterium]